MDENRIVISGPQRMQGELLVQGSKNAALPILAAAVLADGIFVLHHCPEISDVDHMLGQTGRSYGDSGHQKS